MVIRKALLVKLLAIARCLSHNNKRKPQISKSQRSILRSHKIRSTFYTENTMRKLLCKTKDCVATEDKNEIVYEIGCSK